MNDPHLLRLAQGSRDQVADLEQQFSYRQDKTNSFALPPFHTTQDYDSTNETEAAWMLGQGEEGQLNADATCLLQNYWLRVDRNTDDGQSLFTGTLTGRLDLRMNGDDAVLYCNAIDSGASTNFTTELNFGNPSFLIQSGTDDTMYQSFQVSLQDPTEYLVSLGRSEFQLFSVTLTDTDTTFSLAQSETTGFLFNDASSGTTAQIKNGAAPVAVSLVSDATISIATADVAGNSCQFNEWTKNGSPLSPPLYVLSSQAGDLGGLPCIFEWVPGTGFLGIGTDAGCSALQSFQIEMTYGFNLTAGGTTSNMKLDGGSGYFEVAIAPDESVEAIWSSDGATINIGLGTGQNGIYIDFGGGLTVSLESGDAAAFGTGAHTIQFREIDVCSDGTPMKMIVLGSELYTD